MADLDIDEVLNLEEEQYSLGYKEGQEQATKEQYLEGKQYGYQTGFQRFLIVGIVKGLAQDWFDNLDKYGSTKSLRNHINQLHDLISDIPLNNGDEEVEKYEKNIKKARNKLRVIANITKESWKIDNLDNLVKEVGGSLQVSEDQEDMW